MRTRLLLAATLLLTACSDDATTQPPLTRTAPPPAPSSAVPPPSPTATPAALAVRLTGDGIDTPDRLLAFGDDVDDVLPLLTSALGPPSLDSGEVPNEGQYGACPGSRQRALEFAGGALRVLFGDAIGPGTTMYHWSLRSTGDVARAPRASALVGDVTTFEFGPGTTLAELREGTQGVQLEVTTTDTEDAATVFTLTDQSAGFTGFLTGPDEQDTVAGVQAGEACGE